MNAFIELSVVEKGKRMINLSNVADIVTAPEGTGSMLLLKSGKATAVTESYNAIRQLLVSNAQVELIREVQ